MIYLTLGYIAEESDCNIMLNGKAMIPIWIGITLIEANLKTAKIWWRIFIDAIPESHVHRLKKP